MEHAAQAFAMKWSQTCNSHDLDRILSLYSEAIVFKSPRVRTLSGEPAGILQGNAAVRDYWQKILERRPDLTIAVERVFAGVDSIALEYRIGDLSGIEFMTLGADGKITFAAGNDLA